MNHPKIRFFVEVKDQRYSIRPTGNIELRKSDPAKPSRTDYQVQKEIEIRKNQKVIKKDNGDLIYENYLEKQKPKTEKP